MQNTTSPVILVDGSSYFYRAYHAFPPLTNSSGEPTGAIYGVLNMLRSLLLEYQPSAIAVVFDAKGKTFRDHLFEEYKAHRPPMPSDLRQQIEPLHHFIKMMGIALLCVEGVEADDVIGTLAKQAEQAGHQVLISTGDKDMAQLVTDQVTLINTMNNSVLGPDGVVEKYGIPPSLIIDFLALMGDSSDNIPGVAGIGQKTAQALLTHFNGLDDLYHRLDEVAHLAIRGAKKLPEKLLAAKEMAYLSKQLATIKTDVSLATDLTQLNLTAIQFDELAKNYSHYEFNRWLAELKQYGEAANTTIVTLITHQTKQPNVRLKTQPLLTEPHDSGTTVAKDYRLISNLSDLQHWITQLNNATCFAFDTETDSLDYMSANLVGISFAITEHQAVYIPVGHDYLGAPSQLARDIVLEQLKPVLENAKIKKIGQHIKFDMNILARYGIAVAGVAYDTMMESYVLNSQERHDMDSLALRHLKHKTVSFEEVVGKGKNKLTFNQVELEQAVNYAAEDADVTLQLHQTLSKQLAAAPKLQTLFEEIEMPLVSVLSGMERTGVLIDAALLQTHSQELALKLQQLEQEAYSLAGESFNLASPKQLQAIFYDKLGLPILKKTPTGAPSTNEEVLSELALDYPLPKVILEHRGLAKLKSTYTDKLPLMLSSLDGRLHTSYNQAGTITGRLSSSDPNLQNIPIRNDEGRRIRQAFIASEGYKILAADYSQIELRIMAHLSGDQGLLNAFAEGRDIHQATAAEVMGIPLEQVTSEQRRNAKAINFGLIYGMSAFGLARQLGISRYDAQSYIDRYFERYPGVLAYMERARQQAQELGYVETLMGRRLYLPEVRSSNGMQRKAAERAAINAPMQGTAADIIKKAMIVIDRLIKSDFDQQVKMIMQVHDELVFEVKNELVDQVTPQIIALMEQTTQILVPLKVQAGIGNNWDEAH